jgi:hypothetical protein
MERLYWLLMRSGWKPNNIIVIDEDAGTKQHEGLDRLCKLIEQEERRTVMWFSGSRLYRDRLSRKAAQQQ